jgi:hypothetical protein
MALDGRLFMGQKSTGVAQDLVRNPDLADVVQMSSNMYSLQFCTFQSNPTG